MKRSTGETRRYAGLRYLYAIFVPVLYMMGLVGCAPPPEVEVGYQPPIAIPVRVSINTRGEIKVGFSGNIVTPAGTFDISAGVGIRSVRDEYTNKVLIVRVDDQAVVYELEQGKEFQVDFDDGNTLYKKVALNYESNGDIILELESVPEPGRPSEEPEPSPVPPPSDSSYVTISCGEGITQASLRKSPGYSNKDDSTDILYKVDCGETLQLFGESRSADGLTWWKVSWNGYTGWMADHTGTGRTILLFE